VTSAALSTAAADDAAALGAVALAGAADGLTCAPADAAVVLAVPSAALAAVVLAAAAAGFGRVVVGLKAARAAVDVFETCMINPSGTPYKWRSGDAGYRQSRIELKGSLPGRGQKAGQR